MRPISAVVAVITILSGLLAAVLASTAVPGLTDPGLLRLIGVIVLCSVAPALYVCLRSWQSQPPPLPSVEDGVQVPVPGDGIDDILFATDAWVRRSAYSQKQRRERMHPILRAMVINTLILDLNEEFEAAQERIEAGTWTEDPLLASYLSESLEDRPTHGRIRQRYLPVDELTRRTITVVQQLREEASP